MQASEPAAVQCFAEVRGEQAVDIAVGKQVKTPSQRWGGNNHTYS